MRFETEIALHWVVGGAGITWQGWETDIMVEQGADLFMTRHGYGVVMNK